MRFLFFRVCNACPSAYMTANQAIAGVVVFEADAAPKRIAARYFESGQVLSKREAQIVFEKDLISKAIKSCSSLSGAGVGSSETANSSSKKN